MTTLSSVKKQLLGAFEEVDLSDPQQLAHLNEWAAEQDAPHDDLILECIYANGTPSDPDQVVSHIVIASQENRERFPALATTPVHFRKTSTATSLPVGRGETPAVELRKLTVLNATAFGNRNLVKPLGASAEQFRATIVPGTTLEVATFYNIDDPSFTERAPQAPKTYQSSLIAIADSVAALHEAGFTHEDLHTGNMIVCHDGSGQLIDFGSMESTEGLVEEEIERRKSEDWADLDKELIAFVLAEKAIPDHPHFHEALVRVARDFDQLHDHMVDQLLLLACQQRTTLAPSTRKAYLRETVTRTWQAISRLAPQVDAAKLFARVLSQILDQDAELQEAICEAAIEGDFDECHKLVQELA